MIHPEVYGKKILDAFLNTNDLDSIYVENSPNSNTTYLDKVDPAKRNRVEFGDTVYIGLLTAMPTSDNPKGIEPTAEEYRRFKLTRKDPIFHQPILYSGITDKPIDITTEVEKIDSEEKENVIDRVYAAYVANQFDIIFPEVFDVEGWGGDTATNTVHIAGFALYEDEKSGTPFFWGEVKSEDGSKGVTVKKEQVPIIRDGGFKVTMM